MRGHVLQCRYNTVTFARSTNGGAATAALTAHHLVAALPYRYVPATAGCGYFAPSNIIEKDGWFYNMLLLSSAYHKQHKAGCA